MRAEYNPHAVPRYSPVGSNPFVNPKSSMAVRYEPPFVDGPEGEACSSPPPPHAVARMASTPTTARTLELRFKVSIGPLSPFARSVLFSVSDGFCRPPSSPRFPLRSSRSPTHPWVERVSQPVAHQVEGQGGEHERDPREKQHPPGYGGQLPRRGLRDHPPPGRRGRRDPDPQEREGRLEQDVVRDDERGVDDHRSCQVGEDLPEHDPRVGEPQRSGGLDELLLPDRQDLPSDDAADVRPGEQGDDRDDQGDAGLDQAPQAPLRRD